ncbi:MAG: PKD domain-containing protein, partial [Planctomycetota bacterium]
MRKRTLLCACVLALGANVQAQFFSDDFDRADGPADGWTNVAGDWKIEGGELVGGPPPGTEQFLFAGDPAVRLPENYVIEFDIRWIAPNPPGGIGRHGGVMFSSQGVEGRGTGNTYNLWWIDRAQDKGLNLFKRVNGAFTILHASNPATAPADPPSRWRVEVVGDRIRADGDGQLMVDVVDTQFRGGHMAFFTWNGEGQNIAVDNVVVEAICFSDDFERPSFAGWTAAGGTWGITETETLSPVSAGEGQTFAGDPPVVLPDDFTLSFDWNFLIPDGGPGVGRHASIFFGFNEPGNRVAAETSGYQLHWIDRAADRGLNLLRWDGGGLAALQAGTFDAFPEPPSNIRLEVEGAMIRVFGDDVLAFEVEDDTYRGGHAGVWTFSGPQIEFDNFLITDSDDATVFEDDFTPQVPTLGDDWAVLEGPATLEDGRLVMGPTTGGGREVYAFVQDAGELKVLPRNRFSIEFDAEPLTGNAAIAPHYGCFFNWNQVGSRWDAATTGYQVWWINRAADFGLSLARWNAGGGLTQLAAGTGDLFPTPPSTIRVERDGPTIRVYGDGTLAIEVDDDTFRGGGVGLWAWDGEAQQVAFDNLQIVGTPAVVEACIQASPGPYLAGAEISLSALCSFGADAYSWEFGDGNSAEGAEVTHVYETAGEYEITLTASSDEASATATLNVSVAAGVACFTNEVPVAGNPEAFSGLCSSGEIDTYEWDFGGGNTATGAVVDYTFPSSGVFPVTLTISGPRGSASTTRDVFVCEPVIDHFDDFERPGDVGNVD